MPDLTEQRVLKCAIDALNDYAALVGDDHEVGTCNCDLVDTANGLSTLLAAAEGVERDAARYRRIRNGPHSDYHGDLYAMVFEPDGDEPIEGAGLDAAVDAALARDAMRDSGEGRG